ncbi:plasma-membrane proton-efflux P-type ATPase [Methanolacinia petrolearia DSM 11571]|uniref:Plasma-membrane proton-efflux P-type ATPase n=1 Tax=Methanolacinia petrolearia (strain DSM 11571 / OCM 486 / SEBR 4847) TaxID=679926 RepID=E1RF52_METP4|nr:plasma-membrane proton-efflux P-type ATPase [Methanolacinia petrolearia]ADN37296.1 plasma-membrane proton-efflux P-type ATPase [Methanolacinia petrolearia DSM 11571]
MTEQGTSAGLTGAGGNGGNAGPLKGLTGQEVEELREKFGFNDMPEEKRHPLLKFFGYFWGPIPWMIEIAAVLSAFIGHWEDFSVIVLLLMINAVVGFLQERKAENSIELLKQRLAPSARVLRDGEWQDLPARELVPGDIVHVRLGNIVPADLHLLKGNYLLLDESALTGESLPVEKKSGDEAYSGSIIREGEMDASVTKTGADTFFGKTTSLLEVKPPRSHFQKAVIKIGNYLILLAVVLVAIVFTVSMLRSESFANTLQFALVLIVAAIPAALPAVLTVTLAVGAMALSRKEAIVSRLTAIEELAGMDILCSDKTGTITQNAISVGEVHAFGGASEDEVITAAALASNSESNDPIDRAILKRFSELNGGQSFPGEQEDFTPFDPVSKYSRATVRDGSGELYEVAKGAPQAISSLTGSGGAANPAFSAVLDGQVLDFAKKGFRALGVARKGGDGKWKYLGVIGLFDPPREDSAATIAEAKRLGIDVKMVTGDHTAIAQEISGQVGLGKKIIPQSSFISGERKDVLTQLEKADGFAEVFPENKFRIVKVLQEADHIVGMTGDGVNDAPALREADSGIAVAGATDAAKSAADIVLTKPGLSVIIDAIGQSRAIFRRMENYAVYRLAETVRVLIFMTLCIVVLNFYPVTALMIVVLAILNDLPIMMIAYDNAPIAPKPVRWQMNRILTIASILGVLGVGSSFLLLWLLKFYFLFDADTIQTLIFLKLAVAGHMTIYLARTGQQHFWERPLPSLALFGTTEATQVIPTLIAVYGVLMTAVGWVPALLVWGYAFLFFLINDIIKVWLFRFIHPYS